MTQRHGLRMGELLVQAGVLTEPQVKEILETQRKTGRPFGDLAERLFEVPTESIEQAWVEQYLQFGTAVDLESQRIDVEVLRVINRRQAWQFKLLPMRYEADELVMATTPNDFKRAVNFAWRKLSDPIYFVLSQRPQLEQFLQTHYPWPAMEQLDKLAEAV
jgi:MSHA biogenesis protein MshE